ncbi:AvrD family protein [Streptomyces acidiscabies]|uniref:AvrD family protein n=1 Tax=Streptomyces acidiscabies TaxID=42234 RepID=UPI0009634C4D|nr:AvrD family protein [Streptomyces acidiscabies]GAV38810.1 pseudomonas avirulence D protein (AvrD [Streptomyces acidiscabies]
MTVGRLTVGDVEDYLGPAEGRYFGSGFRRVRQRLTAIALTGGPESTRATATASVGYPGDWSAKGTGGLVPHLSTIDALVLAARTAELLLTHAYGLDAGARSRMWLRRVVIRAGDRPQEDLARLPVHGTVRPAESVAVADGLRTSVVGVTIGSMDVRCEVQHEDQGGYRPSQSALYEDADTALGAPDGQYYAELFRWRGQRVTHLAVDAPAGRADAEVTLTPAPGESSGTGMEAAYAPSASMVDAIAVMGQLAQILMYELDGLTRGGSDTLWLRRAELATDLPLRAVDRAFPVHARVADSRLVDIDDRRWRVCDLSYGFHGITGTFSVTHRLPDRGTR